MSRTGTVVEALKPLGPIPRTMRAGVYREKGIVRVEEVPVPEVRDNEVLIKVVADFGNGDFFYAHDSLFAVDAGAHGFGYGAEGLERFKDGGGPVHRAATSCSSAGGHPCELNDNFLMNASRKCAKASAAVLLSRPSRISAGSCNGWRAT